MIRRVSKERRDQWRSLLQEYRWSGVFFQDDGEPPEPDEMGHLLRALDQCDCYRALLEAAEDMVRNTGVQESKTVGFPGGIDRNDLADRIVTALNLTE